MDKEDWKILVANDLSRVNYKYDTLDILNVQTIHREKGKEKTYWVNYKTTEGDWSTGFGRLDYFSEEIPTLLRDIRLKKILE